MRVNKWQINKYLGSLVTVDSNGTTDIKARLTIGRHATLQLTGFGKQKEIGVDLKKTTCTITDMEYRIIWIRKLGSGTEKV